MANIHSLNEDNESRPIPNPWGGGGQGQSVSGRRADNPWRTQQAPKPKAQPPAQPNQNNPDSSNAYAPGRSNIHTLRDFEGRPEDQQGRQVYQSPYVDEIWSNNLPEGQPPGFCELCSISYGCGCCVGPCCSENRKSDWCKVFQMFTFWMMIAYVIVFIVEISIGGVHGSSLGPNVQTLLDMGAKFGPYVKCKYHV
ncbi:MAG: hypothetical protein EZS28_028230 [Streblomastix strix]|uniref:Uncharacterized protein n=1 Tax=Streblomastix strix TaxID=222440 RepID=A0A5J4V2D0_9EUKA|nr:MAG: hypothetical protein EZS28_028230 [Streblomastix strix]